MPAVLSRAIARVFPNNVLVILLCTSTQACIYRHLLRTRNSSCVGYARASGRPVSRQQRDTCPWPHVLVRRPPRGVSHSLLLPLLLLLCTTGNVGWSLEKYGSFLQVNTVVPLTRKSRCTRTRTLENYLLFLSPNKSSSIRFQSTSSQIQ